MGSKYDGSVRQAVDEAIMVLKGEWKGETPFSFTLGGLRKVCVVKLRRKIKNVLSFYTRKGVLGRVCNILGEDYFINDFKGLGKQLQKGKTHTEKAAPVKDIKPVNETDLFNQDLTYEDLGRAVFELLKKKTEKYVWLEGKYNELILTEVSSRKNYRESLTGKDKTIEELEAKVELLRNKSGTFKLKDVATLNGR